MENLYSVISALPFFRGFQEGWLHSISECAELVEIQGGHFIFRQGEEARQFYLILEGKVDVELFSAEGGPVVLQTLQPGDVLGWSWITTPSQWRLDARTIERTRAVAIGVVELRERMEQNPALGFELMKRLAEVLTERLEMARLKLLGFYGAES